MNLREAPCGVCGVISDKKCASCHGIFYCGVKHQKEDWKNHKKSCPPYIVECDENVGRFLVASRNLKFGDVILKEQPLIIGPSQVTAPVCLGCLQEIQQESAKKCSRCGWPMCSDDCEKSTNHSAECKLTEARGGITIEHFIAPHPIYQCILTLRCLLLKDTSPEKWEKLSQLESHTELRKKTPQWFSDCESVGKFIPKFFHCENVWSEEEVMRILGIVYINGHEVPLTEPPYVAIYSTASLFEHSCCANVAKSFTDRGEVVFWAAQDVKKGQRLSICYSDALWGSQARQEHLKQTKMFKCACERCQDFTEFATNFSAIKCEAFRKISDPACGGLLLPDDDWTNTWKCRECPRNVIWEDIQKILEKVGGDLIKMKESVAEAKKFISCYSNVIPESHSMMCDIKCVLGQKIGEGDPEQLRKIPDDLLEMKAHLCNEMLTLLRILAPAENRSHGCMHFELHAALAEMARRGVQRGQDCTDLLEKSLIHAEEATKWLEKEPTILVEGKICAQAKVNADSLKMAFRMRDLSSV
ncbi:SET domain-containing protein [Sergentomyia squamirostris]